MSTGAQTAAPTTPQQLQDALATAETDVAALLTCVGNHAQALAAQTAAAASVADTQSALDAATAQLQADHDNLGALINQFFSPGQIVGAAGATG